MTLPLEDVKVLDLSRLLPGGFCSLLLADLGAHQLKLGVGGEVASYNDTYAFGSGGSFYFHAPTSLGTRRGAHYGGSGTVAPAQLSAPAFTALLQDRARLGAVWRGGEFMDGRRAPKRGGAKAA